MYLSRGVSVRWGSLSRRGFLSEGSLSRGSLSGGGGVQPGLCSEYAFYWNAFLLVKKLGFLNATFEVIWYYRWLCFTSETTGRNSESRYSGII